MTYAHNWRSATSLAAGQRPLAAPAPPGLRALSAVVRLLTRTRRSRPPLVKIASAPNRLQGEMWVEALRRKGIPSVLKSHAYGVLPSGIERAFLFVLASQADDALAVLETVGLQPEDRLG